MLAAFDDLIAAAENNGVADVALCGSVARGEDTDAIDIDYYVVGFDDADQLDSRRRADALGRWTAAAGMAAWPTARAFDEGGRDPAL